MMVIDKKQTLIDVERIGEVTVITVNSLDRAGVDAWIDTTDALIRARQPHQTMYVLHDVSAHDNAFPPYLRDRLDWISQEHPDVLAHVAIVNKRTITAQIGRLFIERILRHRQPHTQYRIFFDRNLALTWLQNQMR